MFLYIATSGSVSRLREGKEFEQRLARARGRSTPIKEIEKEDGSKGQLVANEYGYVNTDSGYAMEFVDKEDIHLPLIDLAKMDNRRTYRVPSGAVESLPLHILSELESREFVRVMGEYDSERGEFSDVSFGWVDDEKTPWDQLMEHIDARDGENPAIDYWAFEDGPDRWDAETIAEARGIKPETVRDNVQTVRKELGRQVED
jgi:hypothetical protein